MINHSEVLIKEQSSWSGLDLSTHMVIELSEEEVLEEKMRLKESLEGKEGRRCSESTW